MRPAIVPAIVAALLGVWLDALSAQRAGQQPIFRTSSHYVAVDVVVTDRDDQPITDLTREDFEITDNGRRQTIADFEFIRVPLAGRTIDVDAPPLPSGDVASNGEVARASRAIVILVDDSSLSRVLTGEGGPPVLPALKDALIRFLESLTSDDQVAIVWQSRSDLSQDFTNDIPRLIAAVNSRKAAMGLTPLGPAWRPAVNSLKFAIDALAGSRVARRSIVFVGIAACNPVDLTPDFQAEECRDLYERARNANVPIYTLDPRVNPPGLSDNMIELSLNTGGLSFQRQSQPLAAVDKILIDTGSFYSLGFYPEPVAADGTYHELKVTVRRPGVRVRARDRYLADLAVRRASTPTRDMTAVLGAGVADPSLPIRAAIAPLEPAARGRTRTLVTIEVAYPVPPSSEAWKDELRVGILALTPDAKIRASFQRPVTFTGTWKPTAHGTFLFNETIDLPPETLTVRVGVTSHALGRTGTAHLRLDVPDVRGSRLVLTPPVVGSAGTASDAATGLDLVRRLVPFQPTTQRTFSASDTLRVYSRAFWGGTEMTLPFEVSITDEAAPVALTVPAAAVPQGPGRRRAALDTVVSLAGLAPGPHVLSVSARVGRGTPVRREIPFVIR